MKRLARDLTLATLTLAALIASFTACSEEPRKAELVPPAEGRNKLDDPKAEFPRVIFADGEISLNDHCMVREDRLSERFPAVYINGHPVAFCCVPCSKAFVQNPLPFVQKQHLNFHCVVNTNKMATIDDKHQRKVNWEIFYLSDDDALAKFDKDPIKYCGILSDPVTGQRFRPGDDSPTETYRKQLFYFQSDSTKQVFDENPDGHKEPDLSRPELWWKIQSWQ